MMAIIMAIEDDDDREFVEKIFDRYEKFQSTLPARGATAILHRYSRSERQYCNTVTKRGLSSGRKASF